MRSTVLSSLLVFCSVACRGPVPTPQAAPEAGMLATAGEPADEAINRSIKNRIESTGAMERETNDLTWSTRGGVVTLRGAVPSVLAKQRLHDMCFHTAGVTSVVDTEVSAPQPNPSQQNDQAIQRTIQDRLRARSDNEVQVNASGGTVTLTGTVPTDVEKAEIDRIAARTQNVVALDDQVYERPLSKP